MVRGPGYEAAQEEEEKEEEIFEGFLPEPSREDILRREAQAMLDSAITLDESNVRVVPLSKDDDASEGIGGRDVGVTTTPNDNIAQDDEDCAHEVEVEEEGGPEGRLKKSVKSPMACIVLTSLLLSSIALSVAIGSKNAGRRGKAQRILPIAQGLHCSYLTAHIVHCAGRFDRIQRRGSQFHRRDVRC